MTYTVKYRKTGAFFWRTIKNVKGDSVGNPQEFAAAVRILILEDDSRVELPLEKFEFKYCPKRHKLIVQNMEAQSGQKLG